MPYFLIFPPQPYLVPCFTPALVTIGGLDFPPFLEVDFVIIHNIIIIIPSIIPIISHIMSCQLATPCFKSHNSLHIPEARDIRPPAHQGKNIEKSMTIRVHVSMCKRPSRRIQFQSFILSAEKLPEFVAALEKQERRRKEGNHESQALEELIPSDLLFDIGPILLDSFDEPLVAVSVFTIVYPVVDNLAGGVSKHPKDNGHTRPGNNAFHHMAEHAHSGFDGGHDSNDSERNRAKDCDEREGSCHKF